MNGGHGDDTLFGGDGNDLLGGDRDDDFDGAGGAETVDGEEASDVLFGQAGAEVLDDGDWRDLLFGEADADGLYGGDRDVLIGDPTQFDGDDESWGWLFTAWQASSEGYHNRIARFSNLHNACDLPSAWPVFEAEDIDELFGEADLDWLFQPGPNGSATWDVLADVDPNDQIDLFVPPQGPGSPKRLWPDRPLPNPGYLQEFYDPEFGTKITRISGDYGVNFTVPANIGGHITRSWSSVVRNRYVTDSPWNVDGSLIHLRSFDPNQPYQLVLNGDSLEPEFIAFLPNTNFRWSADPNRPHIQYSLIQRLTDPSTDDIIYEYDVTNGAVSRTIDLPFNKFYSGKEIIAYVGGRQYVALLGEDEVDPSTGLHVYIVDLDFAEGESPVVASYPLALDNGTEMHSEDWRVNTNTLTFSPDGRHVLMMYDGPTAEDVGWRLLDVDVASGEITPHPLPGEQAGHPTSPAGDPALGFFPVHWGHPVFAYGCNGDMFVVGGSGHWQGEAVPGVTNVGAGVGGVLSFNIRTNTYQSLTDAANEARVSHVTATNYNRPGWVFVSYRTDAGGEKYRGEIVALNLDAPGDAEMGVKRLAYHHTNDAGFYVCQPHLVANRDGTKLIVSSTWGPAQRVVASYLLEFDLPG